MLARQQDIEDDADAPRSQLKVVGERSYSAANEGPMRRRRVPLLGNLIGSLRETIRAQPERTSRFLDRLILVLVIIVLLVSAYVLIADPS